MESELITRMNDVTDVNGMLNILSGVHETHELCAVNCASRPRYKKYVEMNAPKKSASDDKNNHIAIFGLLTTALLGATFVGGQVFEFTEFYRKGLHLGTNMFGTTFYLLTGLHGMHVLVGIIWLVLLFGRSMQGRLPTENAEAVEISGLYWHFVDIVWIFIFTAVYLIPQH